MNRTQPLELPCPAPAVEGLCFQPLPHAVARQPLPQDHRWHGVGNTMTHVAVIDGRPGWAWRSRGAWGARRSLWEVGSGLRQGHSRRLTQAGGSRGWKHHSAMEPKVLDRKWQADVVPEHPDGGSWTAVELPTTKGRWPVWVPPALAACSRMAARLRTSSSWMGSAKPGLEVSGLEPLASTTAGPGTQQQQLPGRGPREEPAPEGTAIAPALIPK